MRKIWSFPSTLQTKKTNLFIARAETRGALKMYFMQHKSEIHRNT